MLVSASFAIFYKIPLRGSQIVVKRKRYQERRSNHHLSLSQCIVVIRRLQFGGLHLRVAMISQGTKILAHSFRVIITHPQDLQIIERHLGKARRVP